MIILDTNILCELMRPQPDKLVLNWLNAQITHVLYVTTITVTEVLHGIARLPTGKRKTLLFNTATAMFAEDFMGQTLDFNFAAAKHYAELMVIRQRAGRRVHMADAQIAAICLEHNATLATRNLKDFEGLGIKLFNPFS